MTTHWKQTPVPLVSLTISLRKVIYLIPSKWTWDQIHKLNENHVYPRQSWDSQITSCCKPCRSSWNTRIFVSHIWFWNNVEIWWGRGATPSVEKQAYSMFVKAQFFKCYTTGHLRCSDFIVLPPSFFQHLQKNHFLLFLLLCGSKEYDILHCIVNPSYCMPTVWEIHLSQKHVRLWL